MTILASKISMGLNITRGHDTPVNPLTTPSKTLTVWQTASVQQQSAEDYILYRVQVNTCTIHIFSWLRKDKNLKRPLPYLEW